MGICEGPAFGGQCLDHGLSMLCFGSKDLSCHLYPCSLEHKRKTKRKFHSKEREGRKLPFPHRFHRFGS